MIIFVLGLFILTAGFGFMGFRILDATLRDIQRQQNDILELHRRQNKELQQARMNIEGVSARFSRYMTGWGGDEPKINQMHDMLEEMYKRSYHGR